MHKAACRSTIPIIGSWQYWVKTPDLIARRHAPRERDRARDGRGLEPRLLFQRSNLGAAPQDVAVWLRYEIWPCRVVYTNKHGLPAAPSKPRAVIFRVANQLAQLAQARGTGSQPKDYE